MTTANRVNTLPSFVKGDIKVEYYDGVSDDLLTAGLGQEGLAGDIPKPLDPENPTAAELRGGAIAKNYKALVDLRAKAGYGSLYGPAVASKFANPSVARTDKFSTRDEDGKVAGKEYMAYADDGSGKKNVTMMVQIPDRFNRDNPCIVATASPGGRGIYGAIAVGEWALKNGCAIVYSDKGTGVGVHDLHTDTVNRIDGTRGTVAEVGEKANFIAEGTADMDIATYNRNYPYRIAQKQAHSQQNPEADWGQNILDAIAFAYYILNLEENFGEFSGAEVVKTITPENTIVIAAGISNGGGAVLRAAEQDTENLIDAVVTSEPNINPRKLPDVEGFSIVEGDKVYPNSVHGKNLLDYITYVNLYQPCASAGTMLAFGWDPEKGLPENGGFPAGMPGRCTALRQAGLLKSDTLSEQIAESQKLLNDLGIVESTNTVAHIYNALAVYISVADTFANSYGRFSVVENLCGYSYASSVNNNPPIPKSQASLASDFVSNPGLAPGNDTNIINNNGNNGAGVNIRFSVDENNNFDEYLPGALCLRELATGIGNGTPLQGEALDNFNRVQEGIEEVLTSGDLQGKPAIIVHGRDDALIHVNFHSRSYYGLNQKVEGDRSNLAYIEVTNAHHLDVINQVFDMDTKIPLLYYFQQALDLVSEHLKNGVELPKSQVVPTVPLASTGGEVLTKEENLPDIDSSVCGEITFSGNVLNIPACR